MFANISYMVVTGTKARAEHGFVSGDTFVISHTSLRCRHPASSPTRGETRLQVVRRSLSALSIGACCICVFPPYIRDGYTAMKALPLLGGTQACHYPPRCCSVRYVSSALEQRWPWAKKVVLLLLRFFAELSVSPSLTFPPFLLKESILLVTTKHRRQRTQNNVIRGRGQMSREYYHMFLASQVVGDGG